MTPTNADAKTVDHFGSEWESFDQAGLTDEEQKDLFESYFAVFPWGQLSEDAVGFDMGCGSGRWAEMAAQRVGRLWCIDASDRALAVAKRRLSGLSNCDFEHATTDSTSLAPMSMDFGYSLGVLHHIPDTERALRDCVGLLKPGAPFLMYLYYRFDTQPLWFKSLWRISDVIRRAVVRLPHGLKVVVARFLGLAVYYPFARSALLAEKAGLDLASWPLSEYRERSLYTMQTDALDRFGTPLEQRFTRAEIEKMCEAAGLERVEFSDTAPFWCCVGYAPAALS